MAKRWKGLALACGWLAASTWAGAQAPPPPAAAGAGTALPGAPVPAQPSGALPAHPAPVPAGMAASLPAPGLPSGPPPALDYGVGGANGFSPNTECGESCCKPAATHFWADFEYILWWFKERNLPALVTLGDISDQVPGALGQPQTQFFFGGQTGTDVDPFSGGRLWLGWWFDDDHTCAVEANGFILEHRAKNFTASSNGDLGSAVVARPFFNVNAGLEDADPIAVPGVQAGTITITQPRRFFGGEANWRWSQGESAYKRSRLSLLVGARYLNLDEKLEIAESLQDLPGLGIQGNSSTLGESFVAYNRFYGGQVGVGWELCLGAFFFSVDGRVAFGSNRETQKVSGFTTITEPDGTVTTGVNRALLVQHSNAGRFTRNEFAYVPETTVHLGYAFNDYVRMSVGYNFLYWHGVARSGENLDRVVAVPGLPDVQFGPQRPLPAPLGNGNFWAQGLSLSLGISF